MTMTIFNIIFIIISKIKLQYQHYHKESSVSINTIMCKVAFLVGILFKDYAGFLLPDQIYTSVLPR